MCLAILDSLQVPEYHTTHSIEADPSVVWKATRTLLAISARSEQFAVLVRSILVSAD